MRRADCCHGQTAGVPQRGLLDRWVCGLERKVSEVALVHSPRDDVP